MNSSFRIKCCSHIEVTIMSCKFLVQVVVDNCVFDSFYLYLRIKGNVDHVRIINYLYRR
jgi:hypothetical protein